MSDGMFSHVAACCVTIFTQSIRTPFPFTILVLILEKKYILLPVDVFKIVLDEWQTV